MGGSAHHTETTGTNQGECNSETGDRRHWGECESKKAPCRHACTQSLEEGECLNLWVWGHWRSGPEAFRVLFGMEKSWARLPELATAKKGQQNWLGQQACFLFFVFLSNSLFFYYLLFLLQPSSSLSCSTPSFSPFISLLPSVFFF